MFNETNENVAAAKGLRGMSRKTKWIALGVAAAVLFGGGAAVGTTLPDPRASDAYVALDAHAETVEVELDAAENDYAVLEEDHETLSSGIEEREAAFEQRESDVAEAEQAVADAEGEVAEAEAAVKKREEAVSGAEKEKATNMIHQGTWTVGVDIKPGTYRASENVGSSCYWAILASGTNGDDIINNDLPGGGRPVVTLSKGQDFNTNRCGSWVKQ